MLQYASLKLGTFSYVTTGPVLHPIKQIPLASSNVQFIFRSPQEPS